MSKTLNESGNFGRDLANPTELLGISPTNLSGFSRDLPNSAANLPKSLPLANFALKSGQTFRGLTYDVEWALEPNTGTWSDAGSFPSMRGILLSGLTRGKDIWVHVRALGTAGNGLWSDPATLTVT